MIKLLIKHWDKGLVETGNVTLSGQDMCILFCPKFHMHSNIIILHYVGIMKG